MSTVVVDQLRKAVGPPRRARRRLIVGSRAARCVDCPPTRAGPARRHRRRCVGACGTVVGCGPLTAPARPPPDWLAQTCRSSTSANVELRRARKLSHDAAHRRRRTRPVMLLVGSRRLVGTNQPAVAQRRVRRPRDTHSSNNAPSCASAHAVTAVDYWCQRVDAESPPNTTPSGSRQRARLYASTTLDKMRRDQWRVDAIGGAFVTGELRRLERQLYLADERGRGRAHRRSTTSCCARWRWPRARPLRSADGRRPSPLFTVLVGDDSFTRTVRVGQRERHHARVTSSRISDDADMETILFDGPHDRAVRLASSHLHRGAAARDPSPRPALPAPFGVRRSRRAQCDVDHIVPWPAGGETEPVQRAARMPHSQPPRRLPRPRRDPTAPTQRHSSRRPPRPHSMATTPPP